MRKITLIFLTALVGVSTMFLGCESAPRNTVPRSFKDYVMKEAPAVYPNSGAWGGDRQASWGVYYFGSSKTSGERPACMGG